MRRYNINLLPQKETPLLEKVMYFSLNYLRYVIIITQLVVIAVFFYRFQIDQRIIDLKESVEQKREIIQVVLPLLKEAEVIDKRTKEVQKIMMSQQKSSTMIQYFLSQFPASISLSDLQVEQDSVEATGLALDTRDLQAFYGLLKKENKFTNVELKNLNKTDSGFTFVFTASNFK